MLLTIDVGNSLIHGGVFEEGKLSLRFRRPTQPNFSSDELGIFFRLALRENGLDPGLIDEIAICTVVPSLLHSLKNCCRKYFDVVPYILDGKQPLGLELGYRDKQEIGADRLANAVAAVTMYPRQDMIIADLGTATTLCAVTKRRAYLGGAILAGVKLQAETLGTRTAQLPQVAIQKPDQVCGESTREGIQSGLYYGTLGALRELIERIKRDKFGTDPVLVIGTSGLSNLFEDAGIFDAIVPDLALHGLRIAFNHSKSAVLS